MNIVDMDYIIAHSRIDDIRDGNGEERLLRLYAESAEDTVLNYLERDLADLYDTYGKIPAPVKQATLMLIDNSYEHRSPVTMQNLYSVPYTFDALIKPYMKL